MWRSTVGFLVTLALVSTPLALEAQPGWKVRRVGFLALGSRAIISTSPRFEAFKQALRDLGGWRGRTSSLSHAMRRGGKRLSLILRPTWLASRLRSWLSWEDT